MEVVLSSIIGSNTLRPAFWSDRGVLEGVLTNGEELFFFVLGGVFCGVVVFPWTLALTLGLGEVKLIAGDGESIDNAEGDFTLGVGVTIALCGGTVGRGGVMDITRGRDGDNTTGFSGDSRSGLINFGEYMDVVRAILREPVTDPGVFVGALFCLIGREGVVTAESMRGKL